VGITEVATIDKSVAAVTSPQELFVQLKSSESGLTGAQVTERRAQYGANALKREHATAARVLVRQFQSPLVYFLMLAAGLAFATNDVSDAGIIVIILLVNAVLGFSQEYRSERAVEKLSLLISNKVSVKRDGAPGLVDATDLVPGDVVVLKEGDVVPADLKLVEAGNVEVDESQLTGESVGVTKTAQMDGTGSGDNSLLFAGSTVDSGELTGVIYATAGHTALGQVAALSTGIHKVTQYQKSLKSFSTMLMKIVLGSLAVTVLVKVLVGGGSHHIAALLIFVIALAVSVVPEALPVIATLTLARGALDLAKQKVVVKRLSSLEDLGDVTLLCTDKTGTLTEGKPTITGLVAGDGDLFQALASAAADPESSGKEGTQTAFDAAFAAYVPEGIKQQARGYAIVGEVPFDPAARRRRVLLAKSGTDERFLVVTGSPETLLDIAQSPSRQQYLDQIAAEGKQGMRHLGLAYRQVGQAEGTDIVSLEHDLTFLGFVTMSDPLRAGIVDTTATARQLGVAVKMLTGDSTEVAAYVAGQVGLLTDGAPVYSGEDLAKLSAPELAAAAEKSNVFARVSPQQKYALIEALKRSEVVGYQGDGVNDAPSLKLADVGIAVDSATDVAKANADIILLDKDLAVVINAISYGRTIFVNINKYIKYTMVGNFGNFMALTVLYLLATNLPLLPRQLLLMSLLTDLPLVAISTDSVDTAELARPSVYSASALLSVSMVLGTLTALAELAFFLTLHGRSSSATETSLYLFLSFTQLVVIFSVRNRGHFWKASRPSAPLLGSMALTGAITVAITYVSPVAHLFSFSPPSVTDVGLVLLGAIIYFFALDVLKVRYYSLTDRGHQAPRAVVPAPEKRAAPPGA
jgi:Mg2+-importing ATPase